MNDEEFQAAGQQMIKYAVDYQKNIRKRRCLPDVKPGFMRKLIPDHAPQEPEKWEEIYKDIERVIMPGMTLWTHPNFHAYFPAATSYEGILGDILSDVWSCIGFTWASSPSNTELEVIMMDWLAKALDLPKMFLFTSPGNGGGVIQGSASEAVLIAVLSARGKYINEIKKNNPEIEDCEALGKLVAYSSTEAHSSVARACMIAFVKCRSLKIDEKHALRGDVLEQAIEDDRKEGLIPFFVCATLGTTSTCAFDNCMEIGLVCQREKMWMHIDAAYAGCSFICPEYRPLLNGVEYADSFNFNPHKWLKVTVHCSAMWLKNSRDITESCRVEPHYLKHDDEGAMPDLRHWMIPLGTRFRALKVWFVLRSFGIKALQEVIRQDIKLAHIFEGYVRKDPRFEITTEVIMALVCFRLKGSNKINEKLKKKINDDGRIHIISSEVNGVYHLRFSVCSGQSERADVDFAWNAISELTDSLHKSIKRTTIG